MECTKKHHEILVTAFCGLECTGCEWKESCGCEGCVATGGMPFHAKDEPCPIAACAMSKNVSFCGVCRQFPCKLLNDYSFDKEHGDNPPGQRIENCKLKKLSMEWR